MFDDNTVLVLGAGASRPYGFPTSAELRRIILGESVKVFRELNFENFAKMAVEQEEDLLRCALDDENTLKHFRSIFKKAQRISIDAFVAGRADSPFIGEIGARAICSVILRCEENANLDGDWYQWLLEFLVAEGRDFPAGRLSIVTFNYDRSLEFYLVKAFENAFGIEQWQAVEMLNKIKFVHIYGSVGELPAGASLGVPFGSTSAFASAARAISLVAPRIQSENEILARDILLGASRIIFLGFGFWKENLDALCGDPSTNSPVWNGKNVFASRYKLWRSVQIQADGRFAWRPPIRQHKHRSLINWGTPEQDVLGFVTNWNLKGTDH